MNLLAQLNACCRRLWRDESGVVLAFTVVVFLSLFVIACSVYAVGENIRQRIELQNAADAAAYSAAVVQADALSRVAAINKAMSWTYVQMCRDQMNYILHTWLNNVVEKYEQDDQRRSALFAQHYSGINFVHDKNRRKDSWIGGAKETDKMVWLNKKQWVPISSIKSALQTFNLQNLQNTKNKIQENRNAIKAMEQDEIEILVNLPNRLNKVVENIIKSDICNTYNDSRTVNASGDIRFALLQGQNPQNDYCEPYNNEAQFLAAANAVSDSLGIGHDTWFPVHNNASGGWGRYRDYTQTYSKLIAEWKYHVEGYDSLRNCKIEKCPCGNNGRLFAANWSVHTIQDHWQSGGVKAESSRDNFFKTIVINPQQLKKTYFEKAGSLVVAVTRRNNNPLSFMASDPSAMGLYNFFTISQNRYAWSVAASRAGYFDGTSGSANDNGKYNPTFKSQTTSDWITSPKNLSEVNWDGLLIPIHQAWATSDSGKSILSALWGSAEWRKLNAGGSTKGLTSFADGNSVIIPEENMILH